MMKVADGLLFGPGFDSGGDDDDDEGGGRRFIYWEKESKEYSTVPSG